jgi:hypothetical protein
LSADEFFGEVIFDYTNRDALADGVLIDISSYAVSFRGMPVNRMTQTLMVDFQELDLNDEQIASSLKTKCNLARCDGGIWVVPPGLWLIENEVNG